MCVLIIRLPRKISDIIVPFQCFFLIYLSSYPVFVWSEFFFFFFFNKFVYLFIFGCVGSSFLCEGFL